MRMVERGDMTSEKAGFPAVATWALASSDNTPAPVATTPNTKPVATDKSNVITEISATSPASRATPASDLATVEEEEQLARAQHLVEGGAS